MTGIGEGLPDISVGQERQVPIEPADGNNAAIRAGMAQSGLSAGAPCLPDGIVNPARPAGRGAVRAALVVRDEHNGIEHVAGRLGTFHAAKFHTDHRSSHPIVGKATGCKLSAKHPLKMRGHRGKVTAGRGDRQIKQINADVGGIGLDCVLVQPA